jgi:hypothetical protein
MSEDRELKMKKSIIYAAGAFIVSTLTSPF